MKRENTEKVICLKPFAERLIDTVDEFLSEKGVTIENPEKEGDETEAVIYGSDYDDVEERILDVLRSLMAKAGVTCDSELWDDEEA